MNKTLKTYAVEAVDVKPVQFHSGEYLLKGQLFAPSTNLVAIVVLNGATGVPARFYDAFARWLAAEKGIACLTYDYRDFAGSMRTPVRRSSVKMSDWGIYDQEAARDFAKSLFPDAPLWVIGHSLGTICLPLQRNLSEIDRVISVASGLVNVRDHPWPYQAVAWMFWFGPVPLITLGAGYMPGKALRIGSDLPSGVYWQWRRWCINRSFYTQEFGKELSFPDWTGLTAETKFVAIADDVMVPLEAVWRLMQCYPAAPKTQMVLRPGDYGLSSVGHINVFSEKNRAAWEGIIADG